MNDIFIVSGIAIISAAIIILLKQYKPEFAFAVVIISGTVIFVYIISILSEVFGFIDRLVKISGFETKYFDILLRCFGICVVTKIASETCLDCGQTSISSKVDFAGKSLVLITAIPLFEEIIEIIKIFIEL